MYFFCSQVDGPITEGRREGREGAYKWGIIALKTARHFKSKLNTQEWYQGPLTENVGIYAARKHINENSDIHFYLLQIWKKDVNFHNEESNNYRFSDFHGRWSFFRSLWRNTSGRERPDRKISSCHGRTTPVSYCGWMFRSRLLLQRYRWL